MGWSVLLSLVVLLAPFLAAFAADRARGPDEAEEPGQPAVEMSVAEDSTAGQAGSSITMLVVDVACGTSAEEDLAGNRHAAKISAFVRQASLEFRVTSCRIAPDASRAGLLPAGLR